MSNLPRIFKDLSFEHTYTDSAFPLRASLTRHIRLDRVADMHYPLELGIMLKGRTVREYNNFKLDLGPGDIWFCGIFEPHVCTIEKAPADLIIFVIDPEYLASITLTDKADESWLAPFLLPPQERPRCTAAQKKQILSVADRFVQDRDLPEEERLKWNCLFLLEVLMIAGTAIPGSAGETGSSAGSFGRLRPALELTLTSSERVDTDAAAAACSMSRRNFDRLFTQALGIPFTQFSLRCRLRKAARELLSTDKPLKTLAKDLDFTDASHLANAFKTFFGCTPTAYRKGRGKRRG